MGKTFENLTEEELCDLMCGDAESEEIMPITNCFHCGGQIVWDNDFDYAEMGYEGSGVVHICHCPDCGAEIEYRVPLEDEDEEE